jgi:hypothetical protein
LGEAGFWGGKEGFGRVRVRAPSTGGRTAGCGGRWAAYGVMPEKKTALQHAAENARHGEG